MVAFLKRVYVRNTGEQKMFIMYTLLWFEPIEVITPPLLTLTVLYCWPNCNDSCYGCGKLVNLFPWNMQAFTFFFFSDMTSTGLPLKPNCVLFSPSHSFQMSQRDSRLWFTASSPYWRRPSSGWANTWVTQTTSSTSASSRLPVTDSRGSDGEFRRKDLQRLPFLISHSRPCSGLTERRSSNGNRTHDGSRVLAAFKVLTVIHLHKLDVIVLPH